MPRAIVALAVHWPAFRSGDLRVEGPDEDAFTLAVAAAEALPPHGVGPRSSPDGIHLVGVFPVEADEGLPEALGAPTVVVQRHGSGLEGLGAALRAASRSDADGRSLVLVAETSRPEARGSPAIGAGAVALELANGPGLVPTGHGGRRHPSHRAPDANGWIADAARWSGLPAEGANGALYFVARESPPVLLAFWKKAHPSMPIVDGPVGFPSLGPAPSLAPALWLREVAGRPETGEWTVIARVTADDSQFLGLRRTGPVPIVGLAASALSGTEARPAGPRPAPEVVRAVSEGAYVPRPRYLENLPSRWRLVADRCNECGAVTFPQRGRCRGCGRSDRLASEELPREGTVLASTVVAPGAHPTEFDALVEAAGPYGVVLAEVLPNVRLTLQVADGTGVSLPVGRRITTELRRLYPMEGEWRYGRKALDAPLG